jgi:short subunit fatty acids transporter
MRFFILLLCFIYVVEAVEITDGTSWSMLSQYALGIWRYYNSTTILSTVPHS